MKVKVAIAGAVLIGLGACSPGDGSSYDSDPAPEVGFVDSSGFVDQMRSQMPEEAARFTDEALYNTGVTACDLIEVSPYFDVAMSDIIEITIDNGFTPQYAGALVGAAVVAICPEWTAQATAWMNAHS